MKIKVGIFFGGPSREREISFAGGRTVYDNLNKSIFEPVPIFIDSRRNFILLDWQYLYKGTIRDFYPPVESLPPSPNGFQVYRESLGELTPSQELQMIHRVGQPVRPEDLPQMINLAFLALHGKYGEDGQIQKELEQLRIPYTGSGVRACQIGMDKALQKELMSKKGFPTPKVEVIERKAWLENTHPEELRNQLAKTIGYPMVIRPANQGSSIGVSIVQEEEGLEGFTDALNAAFFREIISLKAWRKKSAFEKADHVRLLTDIRDGLGFPITVHSKDRSQTILHPEALLQWLNDVAETDKGTAVLESHLGENKLIVESFIHGKEFSCIVIRKEDGTAVALPPTEIIKWGEVFDYRSKYLPGLSRKETPIKLPEAQIEAIRKECERLFTELDFQTYARIDGFITREETIFLNDPNTTSGMLPSSFFFHQAAEIGLNPSQFLTYIIRTSLQERFRQQSQEAGYRALLEFLDEQIKVFQSGASSRKKIGIILGGYSFERHIAVESGRNIYEKLAGSEKYEPIPIFLTGSSTDLQLYELPVNLLLKDNADDIRSKVLEPKQHPVIETIKAQCRDITEKYAAADPIFIARPLDFEALPNRIEQVFIALHGRPGEDGQLQNILDGLGLPYNGSGVRSSSITINKYETLQTLKRNGFTVTEQLLLPRKTYEFDREAFFKQVENAFSYPLIAKPVDDGCSSAVCLLRDRKELEAYCALIFRSAAMPEAAARKVLHIRPKEEFSHKEEILFEALITKGGAEHFLEITGGFLTHREPDGNLRYELFEPSETLAGKGILSLEEKFLAGEGQNITPARLAPKGIDYDIIARQVKTTLEQAARVLNVQGYARIDAFVRVFSDARTEPIIVEVNSLPGMTPATAIFHQAAIAGYKPFDFIDKILEFGREKARSGYTEVQETPTTPEAQVKSTTPNLVKSPQAATPDHSNLTPQKMASETSDPLNRSNTSSLSASSSNEPAGSGPKEFFFQSIWRQTLALFKDPILWKNLGVMFIVSLLLFFLVRIALNLYTHHGKTLTVENYTGMTFKDAKKKAGKRSFKAVVLDSVYLLDRPSGIVITQNPAPNSEVKKNRTIYLTISGGTAPEVQLPDLIGNDDFEQYRRKLERLGINARIRAQEFDPKLEDNTILYLFYGDQRISPADLKKGVDIPKGSTLEVVVSVRNTGRVELPDLRCMTYDEAIFALRASKLELGFVDTPDGSRSGYVVRQSPSYSPGRTLAVGEKVSFVLRRQQPEDCR